MAPASEFAFLDHPGPIAIAHRGGAGDWPENTMPAFAGAVALGYRYVETDVHVTADGVVLAFHDERLDRVTDRTGVIPSFPTPRSPPPGWTAPNPSPCSRTCLGTWPDLRVNIDPKHDGVVEPLAERAPPGRKRWTGCASARSRTGGWIGCGPCSALSLCTSMGPKAVARLRVAGFGCRRWTPPAPLRPGPADGRRAITLVDERFVRTAHELGVAVHVWTIDEAAEMRRLLDLGVDGIMTDRPAVLRSVLEDRGQWS